MPVRNCAQVLTYCCRALLLLLLLALTLPAVLLAVTAANDMSSVQEEGSCERLFWESLQHQNVLPCGSGHLERCGAAVWSTRNLQRACPSRSDMIDKTLMLKDRCIV